MAKQRTCKRISFCVYDQTKKLQRLVLVKLLNILVSWATSSLSTQQRANVLVLLERPTVMSPVEGWRRIRRLIGSAPCFARAVRETQKYGIGWFFISQTLGGLDNEILQQLRILAFGFGLAIGTEFGYLCDFVGGDKRALELYQSFWNPQSFPRRDL